MCPDHPRYATPTKVDMWGGVPDAVNHAKFHQNRLRGFGSLRGQNLPFSYAWHYGLYNRLGLPPNLWFTVNLQYNRNRLQYANIALCCWHKHRNASSTCCHLSSLKSPGGGSGYALARLVKWYTGKPLNTFSTCNRFSERITSYRIYRVALTQPRQCRWRSLTVTSVQWRHLNVTPHSMEEACECIPALRCHRPPFSGDYSVISSLRMSVLVTSQLVYCLSTWSLVFLNENK